MMSIAAGLRSLRQLHAASRSIKQAFFFSCQHQTRLTWEELALAKLETCTPENAAETAHMVSNVACILMNQTTCSSEPRQTARQQRCPRRA